MRAGFCSFTSSISASSMRGSVVKPALAGTGITVLILISTLSPVLDDVVHAAHRLVGDLADHPFHEVELLPVYSAGLPRSASLCAIATVVFLFIGSQIP